MKKTKNELKNENQFGIILVLVLIIAASIGCDTYLLVKQNNPVRKAVAQDSSSEIAVGKPCRVQDLKSYDTSGTIEHTKGLQCYVSDNLAGLALHDGKWIYPTSQAERSGVWIYPTATNQPAVFLSSSPSIFDVFSFSNLIKNWQSYQSQIGGYSFRFPQGWEAREDKDDKNTLFVYEGKLAEEKADNGLARVTITYFPKSDFWKTDDYERIAAAPDNWLIPDDSDDTFLLSRRFELNGTPALFVSRMKNYNIGGNRTEATVYIIKSNSYLKIDYAKEGVEGIDLPVELMIKSIDNF